LAILIAGLILFLGSHSVSIVSASWRDRAMARIGAGAWKAAYSLAALAGLALILWGYGLARADAPLLYSPPAGLRHVALLLMIFVFPLLLAAYLPGRIRSRTRHPMLLATQLWALAHLFANGALADVVLFGAFLAWAVADRVSLQRRPPRAAPVAAVTRWNDAIALAGGLALYAAFLFGLHRALIGVPLLG
jgi:uncharacterized membrane protein